MFIVIIHKRLPMKRSVHLQEVYFQVYSNMFEEVEIDGNFGCMTQDSFKKKKPCNSTGSLMNWLTVLGSLKLLLWWTCYIHKNTADRWWVFLFCHGFSLCADDERRRGGIYAAMRVGDSCEKNEDCSLVLHSFCNAEKRICMCPPTHPLNATTICRQGK